jgi:hypothetical protein
MDAAKIAAFVMWLLTLLSDVFGIHAWGFVTEQWVIGVCVAIGAVVTYFIGGSPSRTTDPTRP